MKDFEPKKSKKNLIKTLTTITKERSYSPTINKEFTRKDITHHKDLFGEAHGTSSERVLRVRGLYYRVGRSGGPRHDTFSSKVSFNGVHFVILTLFSVPILCCTKKSFHSVFIILIC